MSTSLSKLKLIPPPFMLGIYELSFTFNSASTETDFVSIIFTISFKPIVFVIDVLFTYWLRVFVVALFIIFTGFKTA